MHLWKLCMHGYQDDSCIYYSYRYFSIAIPIVQLHGCLTVMSVAYLELSKGASVAILVRDIQPLASAC